MRSSPRLVAVVSSLRSARLIVAGPAVASALLLSACISRHPQPIAPLQSPSRDSLLFIDAHRGDATAPIGAGSIALTADAVYLRAGAPIVAGRANIAALLKATARASVTTVWQPLGGGLSIDTLSGYTFGVTVSASDENRSLTFGRYVAFWTRRRDSPWDIAAYVEVGASPPVIAANVAAPDLPRPTMSARALRAAATIARADSSFADAAGMLGTATAFSGAAADDAVIFAGTQLVVGPGAIKEYFDAQPGTSLTWHPVLAFASASADLGFTVGESIATSRGQSGAAVQRFGKYLTVWRRQADGDWKFVTDGGNARPSPVEKTP